MTCFQLCGEQELIVSFIFSFYGVINMYKCEGFSSKVRSSRIKADAVVCLLGRKR